MCFLAAWRHSDGPRPGGCAIFFASSRRSAGVWQQHLLLFVSSLKGAGEPLTDRPSRAALPAARVPIVICVFLGIVGALLQATLVPSGNNAARDWREIRERLPSLDE